MKKLMTMTLGLSLLMGSATLFANDDSKKDKKEHKDDHKKDDHKKKDH